MADIGFLKVVRHMAWAAILLWVILTFAVPIG